MNFNRELLIAIENNRFFLVKELLDHGANPNPQDINEDLPLIIAIRKNNFEIVKELLDHGTNPNLLNAFGINALLVAIEKNNVEIVKELLEHDADPNLLNAFGYDRPLIVAIRRNRLEIVKELLKYHADPNIQSNDGTTALELASNKSKEMANLLLEHGATFNPNLPLSKVYHLPYYPIERYPLTRRPISSMPFLILGPCRGEDYLPIIRYQSLYYSNNPSQEAYCGTFYYFEPDSNIFLSLGRFLIANNKFHAYLLLLPYIPEDKQIDPYILEQLEKMTHIYLNQEVPKISKKNPPYYKDGEYYGKGFMGIFDNLDQIICLAGIKAGYDTIILQAEPGETRTVTEILDLRPREESFKDVCEVDTPLFHQEAEKSKYPAIWFKSYGFLQVNSSSK